MTCRTRRLIVTWKMAAALIALAAAGCGTGIGQAPPQALTPDSFIARRPRPNANETPLDRNTAPIYDTVRVNLGQSSAPGQTDEAGSPGHISKTVREAVRPVGADAGYTAGTDAAVPSPQTRPLAATNTVGTDQIVGSVLAEVDGNPIYADKILAALERPLQAEARKYNESRFREVAAEMIQRQVSEFIHADLEFAAAKRNLEDKDQKIATQETIQWRQQQIAQAGGSLELAKRKAQDDGTDFEELIRQHFRLIMTQLYYQRRVIPQIQITAQDIRDYYDQNREKEFTTPAEAKFRVIRIDAANAGGKDEAIDKIKRIRERIEKGADFAKVAGEVNSDPALLKNHGDPTPGQWMAKDAFISNKLDDAVWQLQPGQMTPVIADGDRYYIAQLEQRKGGTNQPFEEQAVQDKIRDTLRRDQFNALRDKVRTELERKSVISLKPDMMRVALDMVMQRYPRWTAAAAAQ